MARLTFLAPCCEVAAEAALELVGRHIASHPDVGLKYFEKVAERIKDTGVSVQKRSIKIIRDMCVSNANFSEFTKACIAIISRIGDDESSIQHLDKILFDLADSRVIAQCLCAVSKVAGKGAAIVENLIQLFFKAFGCSGILGMHHSNKKLRSKTETRQVGRSLFCLGLLIRYGNCLASNSDKTSGVISSLSLF
ncbi:hypothetical protein GBA52_028600 [Prunus armeniaca]|nr:hypothetical protein GBA52_028600 [Prunus armeniaca]